MQLTAHMTQRSLDSALGVSPGKTHSCLQALLAKGWFKMQNYKRKKDNLANAYLFTPQGTKKTLLINRCLLSVKEYMSLQLKTVALKPRAKAQDQPL